MILKTSKHKNYELIDSGEGLKLERYGKFTMIRPDKETLWHKKKNNIYWNNVNLEFVRNGTKTKWLIKDKVPSNWEIEYGGLNFIIKPTSFKHIGLFPEQLPNWIWMQELIKKNISKKNKIEVLNLFAYTGGATLACAKAGAEVCHVDASKTAISWAKENALISGLSDKPIRWIMDDVLIFLKREIKRGHFYDAIIMDPPSFGHGPKDELWKIEENFLQLMNLCKKLLKKDPLFVLINGYTAGYSHIVYENNLKDLMSSYNGEILSGELTIEESNTKRLLPSGIFSRWERK